MTDFEKCALQFKVICNVQKGLADELGKDLAIFLQESFFNGEDVLEVEYDGHRLIRGSNMERSIDIKLEIDGIVLQEDENLEDIIKKIEKIVDTIYPVKYEIVNEEYFDD